MFVAEFLVCLASGQCLVFQETKPVVFKTEAVCLDHAEARLPEVTSQLGGVKYRYAVVRCVKLKGQQI